jgi:hypothetical protein
MTQEVNAAAEPPLMLRPRRAVSDLPAEVESLTVTKKVLFEELKHAGRQASRGSLGVR